MTLSGSFADGTGEVYDVSGTFHDTTIYQGALTGLAFNGFGDVKFKGDRGDHLYGQANVRSLTAPPQLEVYFTPAPPFALIDPTDGPVGISNCHIKSGV